MNEAKIFKKNEGAAPKGDVTDKTDKKRREIRDLFLKLEIEINPGVVVKFNKEDVEKLKYHDFIGYKIETLAEIIPQKFKENVKNFKIDHLKWKKTALRTSELFTINPEIIKSHITTSAKIFGIEEKVFLNSALNHPRLFISNPETLKSHIKTLAKLFGLDEKVFCEKALIFPSLFTQDSLTIKKNIEDSAQLLGVEERVFLKAALKRPPLFSEKAETLKGKIETFAKLFDLGEEIALGTFLKNPALFIQDIKTLKKNSETSSQKLKIPEKKFIEMGLKSSSLFISSSDTLRNKFLLISRFLFKNKEDTLEDIKTTPSLLIYGPEKYIIHYILRKLTGKKYSLRPNPILILKKSFGGEKGGAIQDFESAAKNFQIISQEKIKNIRKEAAERAKAGEMPSISETEYYLKLSEITEKYFGKKEEPPIFTMDIDTLVELFNKMTRDIEKF